jgi:cell shape-determining protein MreC
MIAPAHARRFLPLTYLVLVLLAITPLPWVRWLSSFGQLMQTLVAPVSHPLAQLSRYLAPPGVPRDESETVRALRDEVEFARVETLQALHENDMLRATIKELQHGLALDPELRVQQITVPVIGSSGDLADPLLTVRAGRSQQVDQNTVATTFGLQLLGRVVSVGERTAIVAPITSKAGGGLTAVIMNDEKAPGAGLACTLMPRGDGTLVGDVEDRRDPATGQPVEPRVGAEVRLRDPNHWPRTAQMLLVGRVESVSPSPKQPLRKVVTVRPTIAHIERVSEVFLRTMPDAGVRAASAKETPDR